MAEALGEGFPAIFPGLPSFCQVTLDVFVRETLPFESFDKVNRSVDQARATLGTSGRVIVRYSETEPLARITVEATEAEVVREVASRIASTIDAAIGISHLKRSPPTQRKIGRTRSNAR
jgi:phosphoglucosamine mutase